MTAKYATLLAAIVIDANNKSIMFKEGAVTEQVNIAEGTYYLRSDGATSDPKDLLRAIKTALQSNTNAVNPNTYNVTAAFSIDSAAPTAVVTVDIATGTSAFQIQWAAGGTTFDEGLVGFTSANTADNTSAKVSTLSPSAIWVSPEVFEFWEPEESYDVSVLRSRSGRVRTTRRGGPYKDRMISLRFVDSRRVLRADNEADPDATFAAFLEFAGDGKTIETHAATLSSGTTLAALTQAGTQVGLGFHFDGDIASRFAPQRLEPGLSLYNFSFKMLEHVA